MLRLASLVPLFAMLWAAPAHASPSFGEFPFFLLTGHAWRAYSGRQVSFERFSIIREPSTEVAALYWRTDIVWGDVRRETFSGWLVLDPDARCDTRARILSGEDLSDIAGEWRSLDVRALGEPRPPLVERFLAESRPLPPAPPDPRPPCEQWEALCEDPTETGRHAQMGMSLLMRRPSPPVSCTGPDFQARCQSALASAARAAGEQDAELWRCTSVAHAFWAPDGRGMVLEVLGRDGRSWSQVRIEKPGFDLRAVAFAPLTIPADVVLSTSYGILMAPLVLFVLLP